MNGDHLPQLSGELFLTDGGIETTLIFLAGFELPFFAAFDLMKDELGRQALEKYYKPYIDIALKARCGFILESPTWRANADWGRKLGYSVSDLASVNSGAIALMKRLRDTYQTVTTPMVVSGCIGPRGDGYDPGTVMSPNEAEAYHAGQIAVFRKAGADMITAATITNANEAVGISRAACSADMPVVISFTVETDGRLPTGASLREAIESVDEATSNLPLYYMINCSHPTHFAHVLKAEGTFLGRIRGLRANASTRSHSELNDSPDLDSGDPLDFGRRYGQIVFEHPQINILGGCCGTDHRHIQCVCDALAGRV